MSGKLRTDQGHMPLCVRLDWQNLNFCLSAFQVQAISIISGCSQQHTIHDIGQLRVVSGPSPQILD